MNVFPALRRSPDEPADEGAELLPADDAGYEPPLLFDLGRVQDLTLGSSSSGNADSNSQYYW